MNPLALQSLGLAPMPVAPKPRVAVKRAKPDLLSCNNPAACKAAAERRDAIAEVCRAEPMTITELMNEFDATRDTIIEDMRMLLKADRVAVKMHKAENLYWVAQ